jgi:Fe-S oxidoreductase
MKNIAIPSHYLILGIPGYVLSLIIILVSFGSFIFIINKRMKILLAGKPDPRFDNIPIRLWKMILYGFLQWRQPRYLVAGILHILLFAGFMILSLRSITLIGRGFVPEFDLPFLHGSIGRSYNTLKDIVELIVLIVCIIAIVRRGAFRPKRYRYPDGKGHSKEAYIILGLVLALMVTDIIFEGSEIALQGEAKFLPASQIASSLISRLEKSNINIIHIVSYWIHIAVFFFFLNYLPLSKHFHVITALPNVFFMKLKRGAIKPLDYKEKDLEKVERIGIGNFEDFTWKHILDFFSCADCGRCSDNCPAVAVGRPLSPRMITIKARDFGYRQYPVFKGKRPQGDGIPEFIGEIIEEDEIWSCTTCGACERECPIFIEYIDKIVDMRRFLVDEGRIPKGFQKPLMDIQKKGNAYGGARNKRHIWTEGLGDGAVRILEEGEETDILFFVDSCGSYDPRIQEIARSFSLILKKASINFGILGQDETESGNEVRRIGEEGLFQELAEMNIDAFRARKFKEIVTIDPHAFNTIKNDYPERFNVIHYTQLLWRIIEEGRIKIKRLPDEKRVYTYHDPCYLGRHNGVYKAPRKVLQSIPELKFVEMKKSKSKSFCCGGGGLLLWYEAKEDIRMGVKRVEMAEEVGAEVIITACPFCLINLEDAIKTSGMEGKMEVMDLAELIAKII